MRTRRAGVVAAALRSRSRHGKHFVPDHDDPLVEFLNDEEGGADKAVSRLDKLERLLSEKQSTGLVTIDQVQNKALMKERQLDGLMHKVQDRMEKHYNYSSCLALTVFITVYAIVIFLQRDAHLAYTIEGTMLNTFLGTFNTETFALTSTDEFYNWFEENVVDHVFTDPQCGNGICEKPEEYAGFGRFGCELDCGSFTQTTKISIKLQPFSDYSTTASKTMDYGSVRRPITPGFKFNIWSETMSAYVFAEDQTPNTTIVAEVPDGDYTLQLYQTRIVSNQIDSKVLYDYLYLLPDTLPDRTATSDFQYGDKREAIAYAGLFLRDIFEHCFGGYFDINKEEDIAKIIPCLVYPPEDHLLRMLGSYGVSGEITMAKGARDTLTLVQVPFCSMTTGNGTLGLRANGNKQAVKSAETSCPSTLRRSLDSGHTAMPAVRDLRNKMDQNETLRVLVANKVREFTADYDEDGTEAAKTKKVNELLGVDHEEAKRKLLQFGVAHGGACTQHSQCDQSVPVSGGGFPFPVLDYPGQFCDSFGACEQCAWCQIDGSHAINSLCPSDYCPDSGSFPGCMDATVLTNDFQCNDRVQFSVRKFTQPGETVNVYPPAEAKVRYATPFNRLIGGIAVSQSKLTDSQCKKVLNPSTQAFSAADSCFEDLADATPFGNDATYIPQNEIYDGKLDPERYYSPWERMNNTNAQNVTRLSTPIAFFPHQYDTLGRNDKAPAHMLDKATDRFWLYFDSRVSKSQAMTMFNYMKESKFITESTKEVQVEFITFNAELNMFCFFQFDFDFKKGGIIAWNYVLSTVWVDIYDITWGPAQFVGEVICMIMLGTNFLTEVRDIILAIRSYDISGYIEKPGNWFDWAHFLCMTSAWIVWLLHYVRTDKFKMKTEYPILADTTANSRFFATDPQHELDFLEFKTDIRKSVDDLQLYVSLSSISIILFVLRMLKALDFQPRMGLVTRTISKSLEDMLHFVILVVIVFLGYACVGTLLFGHQYKNMSTVSDALIDLTNIVLTMNKVPFYEPMAHAAPGWAFHMFLWSFFVVGFFLLLNIFLAILVDAYATLREETSGATSVYADLYEMFGAIYHSVSTPKQRYMSDQRLMAILQDKKSGLPSTYQLRETVVSTLDFHDHITLPAGIEINKHSMKRLIKEPTGEIKEEEDAMDSSATAPQIDSDDDATEPVWDNDAERDLVEDLFDRYGDPPKDHAAELVEVLNVDSMKRALTIFRQNQWMIKKLNRVDQIISRLCSRMVSTKSTKAAVKSAVLAPKTVKKAKGLLRVTIVQAKGMPFMDLLRTVDPYCLIFTTDAHGEPGEITYRTETVKQNRDPVWNEEFLFAITPRTVYLCITVFDYDSVTEEDLIGSVQIPITEIEPWTEIDKWCPVINTQIEKHRMKEAQIRMQINRQPADADMPKSQGPKKVASLAPLPPPNAGLSAPQPASNKIAPEPVAQEAPGLADARELSSTTVNLEEPKAEASHPLSAQT